MLSTSGDTHLGGDDFDKRIVDYLADDFKSNEGIDLRKDRQVGKAGPRQWPSYSCLPIFRSVSQVVPNSVFRE